MLQLSKKSTAENSSCCTGCLGCPGCPAGVLFGSAEVEVSFVKGVGRILKEMQAVPKEQLCRKFSVKH